MAQVANNMSTRWEFATFVNRLTGEIENKASKVQYACNRQKHDTALSPASINKRTYVRRSATCDSVPANFSELNAYPWESETDGAMLLLTRS